MTPEQAQLVLDIVSRLDIGTMSGAWPHERCKYCTDESTGYSDSQDFTHEDGCIVLKIGKLQDTMRGE